MAKITFLPAAGALDGSETLPIVQADATRRTPLSAVLAAAEVAARGEIADYLGLARPFLAPGAMDDALRRIQAIELYSIVGGVELAWPAEMLVREHARLETNQLRLRLASHDGGTYAPLVGESGVGQPFLGDTLPGVQEIDLFSHDAALGVPVNTVVGRARVHLEGAFGAWQGTYDYASSGLDRQRLLISEASRQRIGALIEQALVAENRRGEGPFHFTVRNERLRDDISYIAGWFGLPGPQRYMLSAIELSDFSNIPELGYWRANVTIRDRIQGVDVAHGSLLVSVDPAGSKIRFIAHQGVLPSRSGQLFLIEISDTAQWTDNGTPRVYSTFAETGLAESVVTTTAEVERFLAHPEPDTIITIDDDADGDFATLGAARDSLFNETYLAAPEDQKYSVYPNSEVADFPNKHGFLLIKSGHAEEMSGQAGLPFEIIDGRSAFQHRFYNTDPAKRIMELTHSFYHRRYSSEQFADQYGYHIDAVGLNSSASQQGRAIQHFEIIQVFEEIWHRAHGDGSTSQNAAACIGMGISARQRLWLLASVFEQVGGGPVSAMIVHNSPNMLQGGELRFDRGAIVKARADTPAVNLLGTWGQSTQTEVYVSADSTLANGIAGRVSMADSDPNMPARARDRWPFIVRGKLPDGVDVSDDKMRVLSIDAGTSLSTASGVATALFGSGYDAVLGRGEALTLDGSTQALAAKLAGLQGATMALARDGFAIETLTIGDYAGQTEAQILASLNAQLANFNIAPVRIDGDIGVE